MPSLRLMAVLAHPDDESLGVGGILARYAREGVDVSVLTATRGQSGRYHGHPPGDARHPRRVRPDVVVTFGPEGAYGHPDHIAISQFTSAAIVAAADAHFPFEGVDPGLPHS